MPESETIRTVPGQVIEIQSAIFVFVKHFHLEGEKTPVRVKMSQTCCPPNPNLTARYHGVSVLLQFFGGDGLPMLEEQVLKKPLKKDTRKTRLPQRNSTKCAFSF